MEPDGLLLTAGRRSGDPRFIEVPPTVVVEVSSPSTRRTDVVRKRRVYERAGCAESWFVDLDADRVEVYRVAEGGYGQPVMVERGGTLTSPLLDGLALDVDALLGPVEDG